MYFKVLLKLSANTMREEILSNLDDAAKLERLYRSNKTAFRNAFTQVFPEIAENQIAIVWNERLKFEGNDIAWGGKVEITFVLIASLVAAIIAKVPAFTRVSEEFYYPRNISFVVLPILSAYFLWKQQARLKQILVVAFIFFAAVLYVNLLPQNPKSNTLILACIHLPLFLWTVLGFVFVGLQRNAYKERLAFLKYNADLIIMTGLILLAGALLAAITLNLFSLINYRIEELYLQNVGVWGLASAPLFATYLIQCNPHLVSKIPPILAKVFTPLVLVTLVIYLFAIVQSGKDPYNDREFLLVFNALLIGVMAIILFSTIEQNFDQKKKLPIVLLFALSVVTIVVNCVAISAILFRIATWGFTPNRLAIIGGNLMILANLFIVCYRLFRTIRLPEQSAQVEKSIALFLPFYGIWVFIVTFLFPLLFSFK